MRRLFAAGVLPDRPVGLPSFSPLLPDSLRVVGAKYRVDQHGLSHRCGDLVDVADQAGQVMSVILKDRISLLVAEARAKLQLQDGEKFRRIAVKLLAG